jgi:para-aminobenzoate synthetase component 1
MDQRGLIVLAGRHWPGAPRAFRVVEQLDPATEPLDDPQDEPRVFLLSYEACAALDPTLPHLASDPALGPRALLFRVERAELPPRTHGQPVRVRPPDEAAHDRHLARVRACKERLLDGVIYQANLAHRLTVEPASRDDGLAFFQKKTATHPPGCAAYVDVPGFGSLISLSPERFVSADLARGEAHAFPIKGTRPPHLLHELVASEKDRAEHVMIVDLLRNDLGKVAVPGGVTVTRLLEVITLPNVVHLESTISARLVPGTGTRELLAATAPGGSITGAPKSSAVETIRDLEDGARGPYCGVLGIVQDGRVMSSLLIRTWIRPDRGPGALHVGGGIVSDSEPEAEWQETLDKARAFTAL